MNHGTKLRVEVSGVTYLRPKHIKILVTDDVDKPFVVHQILHLDLSHQNIAVKINDIVAVHRKLQFTIIERDRCGERVPKVSLADAPLLVGGPKKLVAILPGDIAVNPETTRTCACVILLSDMGKINVADLISIVEGNQQLAVADWNVSGHVGFPVKSPINGTTEGTCTTELAAILSSARWLAEFR